LSGCCVNTPNTFSISESAAHATMTNPTSMECVSISVM
jgi:hypothetical protein